MGREGAGERGLIEERKMKEQEGKKGFDKRIRGI